MKSWWMAFIALGLMGTLTVAVAAPDQPDIDPEVTQAIIDANTTSAETSPNTTAQESAVEVPAAAPAPMPAADPLQSVVDSGAQNRAREAARRLREQNNQPAAPSPTTQTAPRRATVKKGPEKISQEEMDMLKKLQAQEAKAASSTSTASSAEDPQISRIKNKAIYSPAPVETLDPNQGYLLERDSNRVLSKSMSPDDVLSVKMCFSAGLTVTFDKDLSEEFQRVILDERDYFDAVEFDNHRGVYVRLKKNIPDGLMLENSLRLIRKSDDKTYLINILGVPCPTRGLVPFPKIVYLKDHMSVIQANTKVFTPEDNIIVESKGMPRIQKNRIRLYDMVTTAGSKWAIFGVEVQYPNAVKETTMPKMIVLDNHQISKIPSKLEYLPVPSQKATEARGVPTLRFNLRVNISKDYIQHSRYLHVMFLDEEAGHYQYVRVDTLPYFLSLIRRGFQL